MGEESVYSIFLNNSNLYVSRVHETTNAQRKLSTAEKRQKKIRKIKEDTTEEVHVAIYRVKDLSHPAKKYKVETNANQLFLTGIVVLNKDVNLVVVEGGKKGGISVIVIDININKYVFPFL